MEATVSDQPRLPSSKAKWFIIAAAAYLALPFDVVPILGIIGDLGALAMALYAARNGLPRRSE